MDIELTHLVAPARLVAPLRRAVARRAGSAARLVVRAGDEQFRCVLDAEWLRAGLEAITLECLKAMGGRGEVLVSIEAVGIEQHGDQSMLLRLVASGDRSVFRKLRDDPSTPAPLSNALLRYKRQVEKNGGRFLFKELTDVGVVIALEVPAVLVSGTAAPEALSPPLLRTN